MWHFPDELRADRVDDDLSTEINTHPLRAVFDLHARLVIHGFTSFVVNQRLSSGPRQAIVLRRAETDTALSSRATAGSRASSPRDGATRVAVVAVLDPARNGADDADVYLGAATGFCAAPKTKPHRPTI
jgi:hypothetical protein